MDKELLKGQGQRWWAPGAEFKSVYHGRHLSEERLPARTRCPLKEICQVSPDFATYLRAKPLVGCNATFNCHVVAEDMMAEEGKVGQNVVRLGQEYCEEHLVAAEHCKHVNK